VYFFPINGIAEIGSFRKSSFSSKSFFVENIQKGLLILEKIFALIRVLLIPILTGIHISLSICF
jgi:uncharacterized membrane protein